MIEVKELTKRYAGVHAVDHISFRAEEGQILGLLGPNGAGKSTTLNMLTGYTAPTSGQILIDGKELRDIPCHERRQIGYLPEIPPLYPDMTTQEYLHFAAGLKRIPKSEQRKEVERVLDLTDTGSVKSRLIRNLSKGYHQRIGFAQAILGDPALLILDEPMSGLDPKQIAWLRELIRSLKDRHTVILSSHLLSEISALCDHILILSKGKAAASGSPDDLLRMMEAGRTLELTIKGEAAKLEAAVRSLESARDFTLKASDSSGQSSVTIRAEKDIREELFYVLAREQLPILELRPVQATLEKVFLELTQEPESGTLPDGGENQAGRSSEEEKASVIQQTSVELQASEALHTSWGLQISEAQQASSGLHAPETRQTSVALLASETQYTSVDQHTEEHYGRNL